MPTPTLRHKVESLRSLLLGAADDLGDALANPTPEQRYESLSTGLQVIEHTIPHAFDLVDGHGDGPEVDWCAQTFTPDAG